MEICSECNYRNRIGELFCQECGTPLFAGEANPLDTKRRTRQFTSFLPSEKTNVGIAGTAHLEQDTHILFYVRDEEDPLVIRPDAELLVGRSDPKTNHYPEIDLTPHGALEEGVSRSHAVMRREGDSMTVIDMDSVNGTYLNGQRLRPNMPRIIRDGDEIRFGRMVVHVYFKRN